ncbi:linoleate diol synthase [Laccaria bicolor S238N-H82]|uniref:Linoleate diol synthase n=1 Tax=Laccaria bicolor (strain S238N-H82 / ATCC MYA-4686) TaxID=486041 RepID=B0CTV0_LACBS|nr:linoleate diol synthase [Laccaria bicolor S238N-H82]EDR13977.1 linoleate diol synthase [Laccaria bicolor S238N-H82]|eukprot:XP_001874536.1 linoleate diol synthase [Laccaria bicolor S238N-H82]
MSVNRLSSFLGRRPSASTTGVANGTATETSPTNGASGDPKILKDFREQIKRGVPFSLETSSLAAILDLIRHKDAIDDRKLLLEHALTFVSRLEEGDLSRKLKNGIIELLYNDLTHPAATSISNKYAWRTADGSYNNIDVPDMGKAGTPYSRSVQQSNPLPKNQLPDPGLVFDTLLKREGFVKHPGGLSSLMFSFAALVIHSVFRTSHRDININETSSYVDLAPLYGNNVEDQNRIRVRDGRGRLHPDVFAEDRLLLLPPQVCVLLVLFSRNHNYIVERLLEINERGTYVDPDQLSPDDPAQKAQLLAQEEELFQTGRLINCGWFGSVVFSDYFSCILGLVRDGNNWSLSPFGEIRKDDHSLFERGKGNVCSVEFNCLYRWHATTSLEDEAWVHKAFSQIFGGKPIDQITPEDFRNAAKRLEQVQPDVTHWTFGGLQRQENGRFKDSDLADVLKNATEHSAGAFRARGTPAAMRLNEVMGIEQNRRWGVCSLNDFRKYLGLKPYATFLEWNSDPEIADSAEKLYGDINFLELYVGLQAEEAKPLVEGAGLCPGYTISRAILSDAIALTRGDRYFTHDFTPFNLTAWGFADCQRDPNAFGFGSTLGRLFLRTLPNDYTENSVYTFFPLMTPESMKTNLTKLNLLDKYDLSRPQTRTPLKIVSDHTEVVKLLKDKESTSKPYAARVARVIKGKGFFPAEGGKEQEAVTTALSGSPELVDDIGKYFYETTKKLIVDNSFTLVGGKVAGVDLVKHVLRVVPVLWVATDLAGIELKTKSHPHGPYTPSELFDVLGEIYAFVFLDVELAKVMVLQESIKSHVKKLLRLIKGGLDGGAGNRLSIAGIVETVSSLFSKPKKSDHSVLMKRLHELGQSHDQLANTVLALMVGASVELSLSLTNMVNLYLGSDKQAQITALAKNPDSSLKGYVYEALRIDPPFEGVYRISTKDQTIAGQTVNKNDRIFVDIGTANLNEKVFPHPVAVDISRSTKEALFAEGVFEYLGEHLTVKVMGEVLRAVFDLNNVSRAPGQSGVLKRFKVHTRPECRYGYLNHSQIAYEWPTSMAIQYSK